MALHVDYVPQVTIRARQGSYIERLPAAFREEHCVMENHLYK